VQCRGGGGKRTAAEERGKPNTFERGRERGASIVSLAVGGPARSSLTSTCKEEKRKRRRRRDRPPAGEKRARHRGAWAAGEMTSQADLAASDPARRKGEGETPGRFSPSHQGGKKKSPLRPAHPVGRASLVTERTTEGNFLAIRGEKGKKRPAWTSVATFGDGSEQKKKGGSSLEQFVLKKRKKTKPGCLF